MPTQMVEMKLTSPVDYSLVNFTTVQTEQVVFAAFSGQAYVTLN